MYKEVIIFERGVTVATRENVVDAVQYVHDRLLNDSSLSELSFIISPVV